MANLKRLSLSGKYKAITKVESGTKLQTILKISL